MYCCFNVTVELNHAVLIVIVLGVVSMVQSYVAFVFIVLTLHTVRRVS